MLLCFQITLGTYSDIYFVHQVDESNEDIIFGRYGAVDALNELKAEGKIKFTGVATHYYDILLRGVKDKRVDVLQGSGNIFERGVLSYPIVSALIGMETNEQVDQAMIKRMSTMLLSVAII